MATEYRVVTKKISGGMFSPNKTVLVVQKKGRGMVYPGIVEDVWYDCNKDDAQDVILRLFCKGKK